MQYGIAKAIITPDSRMHMIGYAEYYRRVFEAIHDDLYVRCFVVKSEDAVNLIISYDLLFHDRSLTERIEDYVKANYNIRSQNIILSYTHTHYAVAVSGYASELSNPEYEEFLFQQTRYVINKAMLSVKEGHLEYAILHSITSINRRKLQGRKYVMAPNPKGDKDEELVVLKVVDHQCKIVALLVSFACHPNIRRDSLVLSGDYPGRVCQLLEAEYYGATALFLQGCGADARASITVEREGFVARDFDAVDDMSRMLTQTITREIIRSNLFTSLGGPILSEKFSINCPLEVYPISFFEKEVATETLDALRYRASYIVENYNTLPNYCTVHGCVWTMSNNFMIISLGGEVCYSTKQMFQRAFPEYAVLVIAYADSTAYVPSDLIINQGGYEHEGSVVEYSLKGEFLAGIDQLMENAVRNCLEKIEKRKLTRNE